MALHGPATQEEIENYNRLVKECHHHRVFRECTICKRIPPTIIPVGICRRCGGKEYGLLHEGQQENAFHRNLEDCLKDLQGRVERLERG